MLRKINELGQLGDKLINEIIKIVEEEDLDTIAKTFNEIEQLKPLTAFFLGISLVSFIKQDEVSNELLDQAFIAAGLVEEKTTTLH